MGLDERLEYKVQDIAGRGAEAVGSVTGADPLTTDGAVEQKKGPLKDKLAAMKDKVVEKVEDVL